MSLTIFVSDTNVVLKTFPLFLFITLFVEIFATYTANKTGSNHLIYSIFTTCLFLYFYFFYYHNIQSKGLKKAIMFFAIVYPILALVNIFFIQGKDHFHTYTFVLGSIFLIILCLSYLRQLIINPAISTVIYKPQFWITLSLLLFYSVDILFTASINSLTAKNNNLAYSFVRVMRYLNYTMYLVMIIGFLLSYKKYKWKR